MTLSVFFLSCLLSFQAVPEKVAGVVVYGELTEPEKRLLTELDRRMIPLPDTIRVKYREKDNGFAKPNGTIILSADRNRSPKEAKGEVPYLYGRKSSQDLSLPLPGSVHTLSHEIAHQLHFRIYNGDPQISPPEYWEMENVIRPLRAQMETEVELMAAALQNIAFGRDPEELGYPDEVWAGKTDSLVRKHQARIESFYRIVKP